MEDSCCLEASASGFQDDFFRGCYSGAPVHFFLSDQEMLLYSLSHLLSSSILQYRHILQTVIAQCETLSFEGFWCGALDEEDDDIYDLEILSKCDIVLKDEEPGSRPYG